ncbi:MAG: iron-containing alcohol dehydrogenase [Clostridia bacterium]|nr:iron-containing alcohol dehydrogenase [Clostridia bacterium]
MNACKRFFCRVVQTVFRLALPILPYREPKRVENRSALAEELKQRGIGTVLFVTDHGVRQAGLTRPLEEALSAAGIRAVVYDKTQANPTLQNVEEARALYCKEGCTCLVAMGGGSAMDCAKAIGARIAYPKKPLSKLKGLLRVLKPIPLLVAIPTTAGTGSEVTLAAVITDSEQKYKYTMMDFTLIPHIVLLDPTVTVSLPQALTATTGMDALTHAVEAYIGRSTTKETRKAALTAVSLIFSNIEAAYQDGGNLEARESMLRAAYLAGVAFSKSYVGYIHAIAHSLGGQYNLPHGLCNAVLMPYVLKAYGKSAEKKLHRLAIAAGVADEHVSAHEGATRLIRAIEALNERLSIPKTLAGIRSEDIPLMAKHAAREANPLYPVPKLMNAAELAVLYGEVADWSEAK